ncbi:DMT family transporter [Sphingomonas sp. PL-96]|uniref:DMT family transporter n=1 Tax=Sphingomonas sp. PL-96 TaxID=2887201 RepID=UPI001E474D01|nr:DMT family transporter [Sphingomonas sp. PL-96]MCC2978007.1 DMT family transporter [Sphingomonas sp. PL-96]
MPALLIAFLSYAAFAISDASVKLVEGRINPFEAAFVGALLGFAALPFIRKPDERLGDLLRTTNRPLWLLRAGASAACTVCSVIAFTRLPMPEAFALIFLMPLFVTLLSVVFLKEIVGPWRWAAVVLGFVGVLIVLRPGLRAIGPGHVAALAAGFTSALSIISFRLASPQEKRMSLFGAGLIGPLLVNGVLMLPAFTVPALADLVLLASYGLLAAAGQALLMTATLRLPASQVAPPQYSQMIWAVLFSYCLFRQPVDAATFLGIAVIVLAGLLTWLRERVRLPAWRRRLPMRPR